MSPMGARRFWENDMHEMDTNCSAARLSAARR
jgi:hypothetical protein